MADQVPHTPLVRRVAAAVLAAALGVVLLLAGAHLPAVQDRAGRWALGLVPHAGVALHVNRLRYNLFTLTVRADGVSAALDARPDEPFARAQTIEASLAPSAFRGSLAIDSIRIDGARLLVERRQDGTTNWPQPGDGRSAPGAGPAAFPVRRLVVTDLGIVWRDEILKAHVDIAGAAVDLEPGAGGAGGRLTFARPIRFGLRDREVEIAAGANVSWDGTRLAIASAHIGLPELELDASGIADVLADSPAISLSGGGRVDLAAAGRWLADDPHASGTLAFRGTLNGPFSALRGDVTLAAPDLAWRSLAGVSLDAALRIDGHGAEVDRLDTRFQGASVHASGRIAFDQNAPGRTELEWTDVDADRLLTALNVKAPVRAAAVSNGRADLSWSAWSADAIAGAADAAIRPGGAGPQRVAFRGTVKLALEKGNWRATIDQQIDEAVHVQAAAGGRLSADAFGRSTIAGQATAAADAPDRLWRLLQKAGVAAGALSQPAAGHAQADVTLAGTFADPSAEGSVSVTGAKYGAFGPVAADARFRVTSREADVSALEAMLGSSTVQASGSASFAGDRIAGRIDASLPAVEEMRGVWPDWPASLAATGSLGLSATLSGRTSTPVIDGRLTGQSIRVAGQQVDRLAGVFHATPRALTLDRLELAQADGTLTVDGSYTVDTSAFTGTVAAKNIALMPVTDASGTVSLPFTAKADADLSLSGTLDDPRGEGRIELRDAAWADRRVGQIAGRVMLQDHRLGASLRSSDLFLDVDGSLALKPFGAFVVDARATDADIAQLISRFEVSTRAPLAGTMSAAAHVEGDVDRFAEAKATIDLERLDASVGDTPVRLLRPGRGSYDARGVSAADLALDVGRCELRVAGQLEPGGTGTLTASLDGTVGDLVHVAVGLGRGGSGAPALETDGSVHVEARVTGQLDRPDVDATVSVDGGRLAMPGVPPATGITLRAAYANGLTRISQLEAAWQGASVAATGQMPLAVLASSLPEWVLRLQPPGAGAGAARVTARFGSVTPALLAPWLSAETLRQLSGGVSGTVTLESDTPRLADLRGELVLDRADLAVAGVKLDARRPTRLAVSGGRVRIVDWEWGAEGNRIALGGDFGIEAPRTLDLSVGGEVDLRLLGAFSPNLRTGGRAVLNARVAGTVDAPLLDGRIDLQGGAVRLISPQVIVTDLQGAVVLARDELTLEQMRGSANGGTLQLSGGLRLSGVRPADGRLTIAGRGMALAIPPQLKTGVNADLVLAVDRGRLSLTGDVSVLGGSYREPLSLTGGLLQSLQPSGSVVQVNAPEPSLLDQMALDVRIQTTEDIQVNNNYAQLGVGAGLRLRGTVAQPVLAGRAEAREGGRIFLGGNIYQLEGGGSIDFLNPNGIEPTFNITAKTRVAQEDITLELKGPPARLQPRLSSTNPMLSQADIISLLVTGRPQGPSGAIPAVSSDRLVALLAGEFLGVASRAVGLDTLRIESGGNVRFDAGLIAGETDPSSRLTFGKQVTPTVELVFSQNLRNTGQFTWIAAYRPRKGLEFRLISEDDYDRIYDFRHDITIGGPPAAVRAPVVETRVRAVRVTGEPGALEPDLRRRLKLVEGKRFDFFRWQDDRDRIEHALEEQSHFEGHVVARRAEAGDRPGLVDLEYEVHPGPRTVVDVPDLAQAAAIRKAVQAVWVDTPFDAFLIDESVKAARSILVRDGYLRSTVSAAIDERAGEKHLVLDVSSGQRTGGGRIVFSGNQHVPSERLDAMVRDQHLEDGAWIDPVPLERAVAAVYRDEGFLAAVAKAGEPSFERDGGALPVTIDEGREFVIARVDLPGVKGLPADDIRERSGLVPGMRVTRAAIQHAVETTGNHYRAMGFGSAFVSITGSEQENGAVVLSLSVDEGPRQVLQEVQIDGGRRTSPALVTRALRLDIGLPVDPSAWTMARQRLYDTGVFRIVDVEPVPIAPEPDPQAAEQPVRARVTLEEWPPVRLRYGLEVDDEHQPESESRTFRPGLAADVTYRNLFGRAISTGVAGRYTSDFRAVRWFATSPLFFGLPLTSNIYVGRSRESLGASEFLEPVADKITFTAEQRFRVRRRLQIAYSYNFERNHTFDLNAKPDDPIPFDLTIDIARLSTTGIFDSRDDLVDATRGVLFTSTFEQGLPRLGSELRFVRQFDQLNYYKRLGRTRLVFATSGRLGLATGFDQDLILSEKFLAGGGNSVRGYLENSLGPQNVFGDTVGGNAMLVLNEELRFPIVWRFRGVAFFDAGNVFATVSDFSLRGLDSGVGFGLRVQTPVALIRIDLGVPIRQGPGTAPVRAYFSIGQMF